MSSMLEDHDHLRDHVYDTFKHKDTSVTRHFSEHHMENTMAIRVQAVEKVGTARRGGDRFRSLCKGKVYWIFHLRTRVPEGLHYE